MMKSLGAKTLIYPVPVLVIGTYDKAGKPNVMTASWGGICCSQPPCVAVSLRNVTQSHGNILERQAFTISIPSEKHVKAVDYFGLVSGRNVDKFGVTGLTPVKGEFVDAPYVAEFPLVVECAVVQVHELGLHTQFIGEIKDVKVDEGCLDEEGHIDIRKLDPIAFALGDATGEYFALGAPIGPAFSIGKIFVANAGS